MFKVFKKLGDAGLLGVNKPVEYGGMGLDFKWVSNHWATLFNFEETKVSLWNLKHQGTTLLWTRPLEASTVVVSLCPSLSRLTWQPLLWQGESVFMAEAQLMVMCTFMFIFLQTEITIPVLLILFYVAVGSVVDVELILRKGSGPMSWRRTFWSLLSWGIRCNQL